MTTVRTGFAVRHGFPFPNSFPRGTPVVELPTPWGRVGVGDASGGLCGGMVFAALDYYLAGRRCPSRLTPALVRHLGRRLLDSWDFPFGVLKYYDWQRRPQSDATLRGVTLHAGLTTLTAQVEWPKIRAGLDAGMPVPLGVVLPSSYSPWDLVRNHQVLATGYDLTAGGVEFQVYDPNYPNDETTLTLPFGKPGARLTHSCEGEGVRGVFVTPYLRAEPLG